MPKKMVKAIVLQGGMRTKQVYSGKETTISPYTFVYYLIILPGAVISS